MSDPRDTPSPSPTPTSSPSTSSGAPATPAEAAVPASRRRRRGRGLLWALLTIPLLVGVLLLALTWALKTEGGTAYVLAKVPGLSLQNARGRLLGDFDVERAELVLPGTEDRLVLEQLQWRNVRLVWNRSPLLWGEVRADRLAVARLRVQVAPSPTAEPAKPPLSLLSPVALTIADLEIGELFVPGLDQPLRGLRGSASLGADGGKLHELTVKSLGWQQLTLAGQARIATRDDLKLASRWTLSQPTGELPWTAPFQLDGPIADLTLQGALEAAKQRLQVRARLQPFAPFPVAQLATQARDLDLAALLPGTEGVPRTGLTGTVTMVPNADKSLGVKADLDNSAAGRLDQDRLPLRALELDLLLDPANWTRLRLPRLDAQLAGGGRLQAVGQTSQAAGSVLTLRLSGLDSRQIDARWPLVQARGELKLSTQANLTKASADQSLQVEGELAGQLGQGKLQAPLEMTLDAELRTQSIALRQLQARSGPAALKAEGEFTLNQALSLAEGWKTRLAASVQGLDPRRLSAEPLPDGALPQAVNAKLQAALQSVRGSLWPQGKAELELQPSQWQGLPLSGQVRYARAGTAAPDLQADLRLADATLQARSRINAAARREQVDLAIELNAPKLASLQPMLRARFPQATIVGGAQAQASVVLIQPGARQAQYGSDGKWRLQGFGLSGVPGLPANSGSRPALQVENASGQWTLSSQRDAKLAWTTQVRGLRLPQQSTRLDEVQIELGGSWAQHTLTLSTQGQVPLPPVLTQPSPTKVVARAQSASAPSLPGAQTVPLDPQGARARLSLDGALDGDPLRAWRQGGLWQARGLTLALEASQQPVPLLKAGPLALALRLDPGLAPRQATLAPGRIELLGAGVRWDRMMWQSSTLPALESGEWDVQAVLEPLAASPVLAKLQPDFGWGGDLQIEGRLKSRRDARGLTLDAMIERTRGDLTVTDEVSTQRLALTDLRLGVLADQGVWHLVQGVAGENMGAVGGAVTFRSANAHALPTPGAKLEGGIEAKVDNIGNWGPWLPAGWRAGGSLAATLQLGGTLGAPEVRGQAGAQKLSLRNPLLGVDMQQGELALTMSGREAKLEKFTARAGNGTVSLDGTLRLGAQPSAELSLKADTFALLQRVDRRIVATGAAQLKASAQLLDLKGQFVVVEGLFDFSRGDAPQLDSDVQVVRQSAPPKAVDGSGKPMRLKLDLDLDLGRRLQLKGYGIDTKLRGVLHLAQDGQPRPQMTGEVRSEGGTFNAYGQKLVVERGVFSFVGPLDNPRLDVLAIRSGMENDNVRVGVTVTGTAGSPRIRLYSEPDMSETNKLSWLVLGRAPENLGRTDTALMQRAAMALISGDGESASDKLIHNIGLDELSFSGEGDDARGTVVRLGKQVSRNVFVAYERGLNATTGTWQLMYKVAQRFTLRAQANDVQQGLDVIWQWKWE
ncbi:translocation/assembly module TamB domain-containing protein [Mitsuaria sp. GD03876]|uniref:translocation/assembly module TamB domain-containing protein n=1 Tax=Mitsuaria sp. GD03876 TaxID=2975399 RepID=UPI00244D5E66|nr:translocation/assembly module TamB domain-containing protein [Mitsuaria sp. GD03876]MDH0867488.1 translocation/assembly module TamB domain-containing protein [Mitsuaria sp. GD03876]